MASNPALPKSNQPLLRIVMVGKTGNGKSGTANTILGRRAFESRLCATKVTQTCQKETGEFEGQKLEVVDTPGQFDEIKSLEDVHREITRSIWLSAPGPHVFLVVIKIGRFTPEEQETVKILSKIFGEQAPHYTMTLFTHGDNLEDEGTTVEEFIGQSEPLKAFIIQCGGGYHVFSNRSKDPSQVRELLKKINMMVERNGGEGFYTNEMFKKAEILIQKEAKRQQRENPNMSDEEGRKKGEENEQNYKRFLGFAAAILAILIPLAKVRACSIQ